LKGFERRSIELFEGVPTRDILDEGVASPPCVEGRGRYLNLCKCVLIRRLQERDLHALGSPLPRSLFVEHQLLFALLPGASLPSPNGVSDAKGSRSHVEISSDKPRPPPHCTDPAHHACSPHHNREYLGLIILLHVSRLLGRLYQRRHWYYYWKSSRSHQGSTASKWPCRDVCITSAISPLRQRYFSCAR
jgi:hypothetical protein